MASVPHLTAALVLALGPLMLASPGFSQAMPTPAPVATNRSADADALQQYLAAAQREIVRLREALASQRESVAALAECRDRNGRLVAIGDALIASYRARYRHGRFQSFDTGMHRFEAEMQDVAGRVYDNRADAGPRRPEHPVEPVADPSPGQDIVPDVAPAVPSDAR